MLINGFGPIINKDSRTLILGSMPSVSSLHEHRYYAYARNQFWRLICDLYNQEYIENYEERLEFLLSKNLALWDVVKSCERQGSLDSDIKKPLVNNFKWLFVTFPNITRIVFNGTKSKQLFLRNVNKRWYNKIDMHIVPSSSPANTTRYADKLMKWKSGFGLLP